MRKRVSERESERERERERVRVREREIDGKCGRAIARRRR